MMKNGGRPSGGINRLPGVQHLFFVFFEVISSLRDISLLRYDHPEVKHTATKFIRHSLMNLTVTVEFRPGRGKRYIYANFDPVNRAILTRIRPFT